MSLENLKPAKPQEVNVYTPYYQGRKRNALPYVISLYREGNLEGFRNIEGGEGCFGLSEVRYELVFP